MSVQRWMRHFLSKLPSTKIHFDLRVRPLDSVHCSGGKVNSRFEFRVRHPYQNTTKGGFYSEVADTFVISSSRQTLLFSWAWTLKLWNFKWLKSCHICRKWSEGSNSKIEPYMILQSHFRAFFNTIWVLKNFKSQAQENNKVCLFEEMANASAPSE